MAGISPLPLGRTDSRLARVSRHSRGQRPPSPNSPLSSRSHPLLFSPVFPRSNLRVLLSPTAFKGTLSPVEAARRMERIFRRHTSAIHKAPLADGGDGTLEVLAAAFGGKLRRRRVTGPLGRPVVAAWALVTGVTGLPGRTAVIEMARASGLALTRGKNRVMEATSYGTGELIRAAMNAGCRNVLIGVGGTATAEGGAGALEALGFRYFDRDGRPLRARPKDLLRLARVDRSGADPRLRRLNVFVLCDVRNPLLGPRGSARTFAPQKGATPAQVATIERFLRHWARFAARPTQTQPGAGAAGALAFGLSGFIGARLVEGTPFVMRAVRWKERARKADLIVTGEGRLDSTSFGGKVAGEVACHRGRARVVVVCGTSRVSSTVLKKAGIDAIEELGPVGLRAPERALESAARRLCQKIF